MLPPAHRLRGSADFAATIRGGRRAGAGSLVVHLSSTADGGAPRAGFVVSGKVGNSVVRHRVTRRLRPLVRERLGELPPGTRLVVRALPAAAGAASADLAADLSSALTRDPRHDPRHEGSASRRGYGRPAGARAMTAPVPVVPADNRPADPIGSPLARVLVVPIRWYQRYISRYTPPSCRYYPCCSAYAITALRTHGAVVGTGLTVWRLLRCNPWSEGGIDHVPPKGQLRRADRERADAVESSQARSVTGDDERVGFDGPLIGSPGSSDRTTGRTAA